MSSPSQFHTHDSASRQSDCTASLPEVGSQQTTAVCKEDLEASGAQLVQGIVQAPENGFVVLARRGLQGILWRHRKRKESDNIQLICHRQIK